MASRANDLHSWIRSAVRFVAWGVLFSLVYGQSPLYTSNQNQYFLHGAAQAGIGLLAEDWLANTVDSVPVFTSLLTLTYRYLHELLFYLYFALLCAVYLYSLLRILHPRASPPDPTRRLITLTLLLGLHSAALRFVLARGLGEEWAYLFDGGVAGQRLLGTVLQPSVFGVFLLLSVALFLERRPWAAALALAVAATLHPTYLLSAGLLMLAYLWVTWKERHALRPVLAIGLPALVLVLPIALYVFTALGPTSPQISAQAQEILVEERIPHHAVVGQWLDATTGVKLALILAALACTRRSRLFPILLLPLLLGLSLTAIQVAADSNTLALLFPWRVSALLVPLSTAVLVDWAVGRVSPRVGRRTGAARRLCVLTVALLALAGGARLVIDLQELEADPAGPMMAFVRENRAPGQVYLIPPDLQQFRLATGLPAFVDLKSIPYHDGEVVEWFTRMRIEGWIYRDRPQEVDCTLFDQVRAEYGVTHVVLDRDLFDLSCPALGPKLYADPTYAVHGLRAPSDSPVTESLKRQFLLDPSVIYLNHGAFGACPRPVFEAYQRWQHELERQPTEFLGRRAVQLLAEARAALAAFLHCLPDEVVYFPNPTTALNAVARSLELAPGDEILTTDHEYGALDRTWRFLCGKAGASYLRRPVPLPLTTAGEFVANFWSGVTRRTRAIFLSHITSPTALIFPVAEICRRARESGVLSIIDGAHAPGHIPLDLTALGADIYAGACHKWLCAPKGSSFLYARRDIQLRLEPLVVSWGWEAEKPSASSFIDYHEWQGTRDLAAFLATPAAIDFQARNNWPAVRLRCHELARGVRSRLQAITTLEPIGPDSPEWFGQMAAVRLPKLNPELLQRRLFEHYRIEVPVFRWNEHLLLRVSFQAYNDESDADALVEALGEARPTAVGA